MLGHAVCIAASMFHYDTVVDASTLQFNFSPNISTNIYHFIHRLKLICMRTLLAELSSLRTRLRDWQKFYNKP